MTTLACVAGGIVCEGKVLVAEPPWAASRLRRSNFVQTIPPATQAMTTSEHYSTNVQTFVAEDSRRGSDNFWRLPNVAVRSSKLAWSCKLLIEDTHATLSTVHSWTILFGKWTPFFTQLWVRSEKLFFTHVIACTWSVDMPRCGFCWYYPGVQNNFDTT